MLWRRRYKQMDVIWHDLQAQYLYFLFICNEIDLPITPRCVDLSYE